MRMLRKLIATGAVVASATALAIVPALADPINGSGKPVTPRAIDIVGTGSDTIEFLLDQMSLDYNAQHAKADHLYSWDALNPKTGAMGDMIQTKTGCAKIARPDGSTAGIEALQANTQAGKKGHKYYCIDYARSSAARSTQTKGPGGVLFVAIGKDAVTYATNGGSNAPTNLSTAQLAKIYTCTVTNWKQVGGKNAPIDAQLPQTSSGTRKFFLTALGNGTAITPGSCVDSSKNESPNNLPEENEGTNKYLQGKDVIYPFSVGKYLAEFYHSAKCGVKPTKNQNRFGCDDHGDMQLRDINHTTPTTGIGNKQIVNLHFSANFVRTVYIVVRWAHTADNIPAYLEPLFASAHAKVKGWICTNKAATKDLVSYGFLPTPFCGTGS